MQLDPVVTVVIATRDRAARAVAAVESVVACEGPAFKLILVDQSADDRTAEAVRPWLQRAPVHYLRMDATGVSVARNLGAAHARTELVAFTDDDCTATPGWLTELTQAFATAPRIAAVFGNVLPGRYDPASSFLISYRRQGTFLARTMRDKHRIEGIGGCMAWRRSAWSELGGFDEMLGPGSRFRSGEELDLVLRALQAGFLVYETDRAAVVHHGSRERSEKARTAYAYLYGIGAVYSKHLKCRRWSVLAPLSHLARRWTFGNPVVDYGEAPPKRVRLRGFVDGFIAGAASRVETTNALYCRA
jgi:GT2 family glycosyltransferase